MGERRISKNHLLYDIDKCKTVNELYNIVRKNGIAVRMQTLHSASNIFTEKSAAPGEAPSEGAHLERLKRYVMQAVEEQSDK